MFVYLAINLPLQMYNFVQYSFKVWITSALAVPHIYLLHYLLNAGGSAFPANGYAELLAICLLASMPAWFIYMLTLDAICRTSLSVKAKRILGLISFEAILLLLFMVIICLGGRHSMENYIDFIIICCFTAGISTTFYKLQPLQEQRLWQN